MRFYFVDLKGNPVAYNALVPGDAWTQNKGQKQITVIRSSCWAKMAKIAGVEDVPEQTEIQIYPSKDNMQTVAVKYVVKRQLVGNHQSTCKYFTGFGSSNELSVIKQVNVFNNKDGTQKEVVSGNALHAVEMAVKRAHVAAIAAALGFEHGEAREIMESNDYILNPELRNMPITEYSSLDFQDLQKAKRNLIPAGSKEQSKVSSVPQTTNSQPRTPQQTSKPEMSNAPQTSQSKPSTPPTKPPVTQTPAPVIENPGEVIVDFGDHKGKALITILGLKPSYVSWLAESARDPKIKAAAAAVIAQHPNLAATENKPITNKPTNESQTSSRDKVRLFWQSRGYEPKTEVKKILSDALHNPNLSWNSVTEEDAAKLYEQREILFPIKNNLMEPVKTTTLPPPVASKPASSVDSTQATDKECSKPGCGKKLYPIELELSNSPQVKEITGGALLCFEHINIVKSGNSTTENPKCKQCTKTLTEQELEFICKWGGDPLCANCQAPK